MKIDKEMVEEVFGSDAETIIKLYEGSDFTNYEDFFVYSVQNYFNFLELDRDIDSEKKEILESVFNTNN